MNNYVEIILVEDNPYEAELAIHSLKKKSPGKPVNSYR